MKNHLKSQWKTEDRIVNLEIYLDRVDRFSQDYIVQYHRQLLPEWNDIPKTIVFVLFQCQILLDGSNLMAEELEKQKLWQVAVELGERFYQSCQSQQILGEVVCPKTGYPFYSQQGSKNFHLSLLITRYVTWKSCMHEVTYRVIFTYRC